MNFVLMGAREIAEKTIKSFQSKQILPSLVITMTGMLSQETIALLKDNNVKLLELTKFKKNTDLIISLIKENNIDMIMSVAFPFIIPEEILKTVKYPINLHTAALPKYRGVHPISAALLNDEKYQGTTVHFMKPEVDSGEIILQDFIEVKNEDTIITIKNHLIDLSIKLLLLAYNQIISNDFHKRKQVGEPIFAPKRTPGDSKTNFNNNSRYLHNFIRALADPYPNAFAKIEGSNEVINIKKSLSSNRAGVVLDKTESGKYVISTKDGVIVVELDKDVAIGSRLA